MEELGFLCSFILVNKRTPLVHNRNHIAENLGVVYLEFLD